MEERDQTQTASAYCVKCKEKRIMVGPKTVYLKGKNSPRKALKGNCSICGTPTFRIVKNE